MDSFSKQEQQLIKRYILNNLEPCKSCLLSTCCTKKCDKLFDENMGETIYMYEERIKLIFIKRREHRIIELKRY